MALLLPGPDISDNAEHLMDAGSRCVNFEDFLYLTQLLVDGSVAIASDEDYSMDFLLKSGYPVFSFVVEIFCGPLQLPIVEVLFSKLVIDSDLQTLYHEF